MTLKDYINKTDVLDLMEYIEYESDTKNIRDRLQMDLVFKGEHVLRLIILGWGKFPIDFYWDTEVEVLHNCILVKDINGETYKLTFLRTMTYINV